jgi:hypothetical protein
MNGTQAVGSVDAIARIDHVHPTDTSRQATLVSGTNIKTINGSSILGSGDLTVSGGGGGTWGSITGTLSDQTDLNTSLNGKMPLSGGTFTGAAIAQANTNYSTAQIHNIRIYSTSDTVPTLANGEIALIYTP